MYLQVNKKLYPNIPEKMKYILIREWYTTLQYLDLNVAGFQKPQKSPEAAPAIPINAS